MNIIKEKHLREDRIKILKTTFGSVEWGLRSRSKKTSQMTQIFAFLARQFFISLLTLQSCFAFAYKNPNTYWLVIQFH